MARVCVDSNYFTILPSGELSMVPGSMGLRQLVVFSATGNSQFIKANYPGLARVRVRVIGAGGGGGGSIANNGEAAVSGGGGGGGYSESIIDAAVLAAIEIVTVGVGGAGGVGNSDGASGNPSSFGPHVQSLGGGGGPYTMTSGTTPSTVVGGAGASVGVGQVTVPGGPGHSALRLSNLAATSGRGGDPGGAYGTGGPARSNNGTGPNAVGRGGGGAGAAAVGIGAASNQTGGMGSAGLVLVELIF